MNGSEATHLTLLGHMITTKTVVGYIKIIFMLHFRTTNRIAFIFAELYYIVQLFIKKNG